LANGGLPGVIRVTGWDASVLISNVEDSYGRKLIRPPADCCVRSNPPCTSYMENNELGRIQET